MIDVLNFLAGCVASFVLGMAVHSVLGHYCATRRTGICRFFHHEEEPNVKEGLSNTKTNHQQIIPNESTKRPIPPASSADELRVIPVKINLQFRIEPKDERAHYVELLNMMIRKLEAIVNGQRTRIPQRLRAMKLLTDLIQTSYTIVRDVDIENLERDIETIEDDLNDAS